MLFLLRRPRRRSDTRCNNIDNSFLGLGQTANGTGRLPSASRGNVLALRAAPVPRDFGIKIY